MISKYLRKLTNVLYIKLHEKTYCNRLHFLFNDNRSNVLLIVFPAFTGEKRRYNYIKGLMSYNVDKLFLLDDFGIKGSYFLFENGNDIPMKLTKGLLSNIINRKKYDTIITLGTSKGGTCAIYFGLEFNVDYILTGACQYNLGTYLHREDHEDIFKGMMGQWATQIEANYLDGIIPTQLEQYANTKSYIYNIYSEKELTYQRQIVDLNNKLEECCIPHKKIILDFENHDDVGVHFLSYIHTLLPDLIKR